MQRRHQRDSCGMTSQERPQDAHALMRRGDFRGACHEASGGKGVEELAILSWSPGRARTPTALDQYHETRPSSVTPQE